MRITESARKHGVTDAEIHHALRNFVRFYVLDDLTMYVGPTITGAMLEVGVVEDDDPRIIHAMPARRKFWP